MPTRPSKAAPRRKPTRTRAGFPLRASLSGRHVADVSALISIVLGVICALALTFPSGQLTGPLLWGMTLALGWTAFFIPIWLIALGGLRLLLGLRPAMSVPVCRLAGAVLITISLPALLHLLPIGEPDSFRRALDLREGGGALGYYLSAGLSDALGSAAAAVVLLAAVTLGMLLLFELTLTDGAVAVGLVALATGRTAWCAAVTLRRRLFAPRLRVNRLPADDSVQPLMGPIARVVKSRPAPPEKPDPVDAESALSLPLPVPGVWQLPPTTLLVEASAAELSQADIRAQARTIEETLASFNIGAKVVEVNSGPTVTQFGLEPAPGVTVNRILARNNDLALRLGAVALRLEAPVPGKRVVGVEVPNRAGAMVGLREVIESDTWNKLRSRLRLALGRNVSGNAVVGDLTKMPHLLIAGATGSGKSVCINSIIASLIFQSTPDELQFVMIDPKMVELVGLNGIPHLRMPVVTDMERVVGSLKWVVREMERRYSIFAARTTRNIDAYNKSIEADPSQKPMPYLVVVIDELADMMMTAGDEVERILCRLAQLARATGIHLVVATQRPSVDVITGLIKANFPTRISFAVSSHIDSRTILDSAGAEKLLGRGDGLFLPQDSSKPIRIQGTFISDEEMQRVVHFWRALGTPRYSDEDVREMESLGRAEDEGESDEMYEKAVDVATHYRRISASLLQRRLGVGYPRAARLVDLMEDRGVVGPAEDGKSREVLEREPLGVE